MRRNAWFRAYSEALDDPKVQRLHPNLFKAWFNLLCLACEGNGRLPSDDDIAFRLRISVQDAKQHVDELILVGLIDIETSGARKPHNWETRQFVSDTSTERVRKHRETKKKTACNVSETPEATPPEQSRAETDQMQSQSENTPNNVSPRTCDAALSKYAQLEKKLIEACNGSLANPAAAPGLLNLSVPMWWLEQGCDLDRDVIPTLREIGAKRHGAGIKTWEYFTKPVTAAKAKRERVLPDVEPAPAAVARRATMLELLDQGVLRG